MAENTFTPNPEYLVQVSHLKQYFPISTGFLKTTMLKAVDDVSFTIKKHAIHQSIRQPFDQEIDDCHGQIDGYQMVLRL